MDKIHKKMYLYILFYSNFDAVFKHEPKVVPNHQALYWVIKFGGNNRTD